MSFINAYKENSLDVIIPEYPFGDKKKLRRKEKRLHNDRKQKHIFKCTHGHGAKGASSHPTMDKYYTYGCTCDGPMVKGKAMKKQCFRGQKGKTKGYRDLVQLAY